MTDNAGAIVEKRHFDAWGNVLLVQNGQNNNLGKLTFLERGYTGHEHLQGVDLINMNARLYDAKLHRFLAPDNFIQEPDNSQNYNRYGYVMNNPLKYTDESGEIIFTVITAVVNAIKEFVQHGVNFNDYNWHQTNMAWDIDRGMFKGNFGQILEKWSPWGVDNELIGNVLAHAFNLAGTVNDVTYLDGAIALDTAREGGAFTMGHYINGERGFKADWRDHLFVHEYGHIKQRNIFGPLYISLIAIPSVMDNWLQEDKHETRWYEAQASSLGGKYFDKHYGSGADGYIQGNVNFFDLSSFKHENILSPYINPRNGGNNRGGNTSHYNILWSDAAYFLFGRIF